MGSDITGIGMLHELGSHIATAGPRQPTTGENDLGITEEEAYLSIQKQSRRRHRPMRGIAEAIILSDGIRRVQTGS